MCSNPCESEVTCFRPESNRGHYGLLNFLCAALSTTELWWQINHRKSFRTLSRKNTHRNTGMASAYTYVRQALNKMTSLGRESISGFSKSNLQENCYNLDSCWLEGHLGYMLIALPALVGGPGGTKARGATFLGSQLEVRETCLLTKMQPRTTHKHCRMFLPSGSTIRSRWAMVWNSIFCPRGLS